MKERGAHQKASRSSQRLCPVTFEPGTRQRDGGAEVKHLLADSLMSLLLDARWGGGGQAGRCKICNHVTWTEVDFRPFHHFLLAKIIELVYL